MTITKYSISFLEAQLEEIDNIINYGINSRTYEARKDSILKKLAFQYMRSKFIDHENTFKIMSRA